jgi:hypothetical protein
MTEDRERTTEDGIRTAEDRGQKAEINDGFRNEISAVFYVEIV